MKYHSKWLLAGIAIGTAAPMQAQETQPPSEQLEEVVVTGFRGALASGIETKRAAYVQVDQINASDVADFPDSNLAEAIQRLPGVSINRENGEGKTLTVRGLGGDFTTTTVNGMDVLSTSGGGNSGSAPNRSRAFDFNTFASELFSSLSVQKTASASTDEGSLGATVALNTGRPLEYGGYQVAFSGEGAYYESGAETSPRLAGLITNSFFENKLGFLVSAAYSKRDSTVDKYDRNIGQFEVLYRNSQHTGITPATYGFARPSNAVNANPLLSCVTNPNQVGCGSNPAAYAQLDPTAIIPTLATLSHQELEWERLGLTATAQWAPTDGSMVTLDYLKSSFESIDTIYDMVPVGGNRNLYSANAASNPGALTLTQRRALYPTCTQIVTGISPQDCGQALNGNTLVPGTSFSFNPNNLEAYDYYNSPASPGYTAHPNNIGTWAELVGRPGTQVRDVNVVVGEDGRRYANYLVLDNVDWRNATDGSDNTTDFQQLSLNFDQKITEKFKMHALVGVSKSEFFTRGMLVEFNNLDKDGFVYDERSGGMPVFDLGFDPADPTQWDIVKGFTNVRNVIWNVDNQYRTAKLDFNYQMTEAFGLNFGVAHKEFENKNREIRRNSAIEVQVPTLLEANLPISALGHMVSWGEGIDVSPGTPTSWFAPSFAGWREAFDVECNCINQWGDWRLNERTGSTNIIDEFDNSGFLEFTFNTELAGRKLFGNVGARYAETEVKSAGYITAVGGSQLVTAENKYDDFLPSFNVAYEVVPETLLRVAYAKVMARPKLSDLRPNGTLPTSCTGTPAGCASNPSISMGNPFLDPFRADNYDLSLEWYFSEEGLLAAAFFYKDIESFPQNVRTEGLLSVALQNEFYDNYVASIVDPALRAHIANDGTFLITQQRDAPGGFIKGFELSYQQPFTFLPAPFDKFGVIANYTHIESELDYIINTITGETATGPYLDASPDAFNATLYYQTDKWQARVSGSYRSEYMQAFPLVGGTCEIGLTTNNGGVCNSPVFNDFRAVRDNLYVDASFRYDFNDFFSVTAEVQNLTDEVTEKWAYQDVQFMQQLLGSGRIYSVGLRMKL